LEILESIRKTRLLCRGRTITGEEALFLKGPPKRSRKKEGGTLQEPSEKKKVLFILGKDSFKSQGI